MESDSSIFAKLLLGPGPSTVPDRILKSMANRTISHLDPDFFKMLDETSENLRLLFETKIKPLLQFLVLVVLEWKLSLQI